MTSDAHEPDKIIDKPLARCDFPKPRERAADSFAKRTAEPCDA